MATSLKKQQIDMTGPAQQDFDWGGLNVSQPFFFSFFLGGGGGGGGGGESIQWHAALGKCGFQLLSDIGTWI